MSVHAGFVFGTLVGALTNLPDVVDSRRLFTLSAIVGAVANCMIPMFSERIQSVVALRFLTGVALAGAYPTGMKIVASWFREGRGMVGVLVEALSVGSPYLLKAFGTPDWRTVMLVPSGCAALASVICLLFVSNGPHLTSGAIFYWRYVGKSLNHIGIRLVNFGYLGHTWELYVVWTWVPVFLLQSFTNSGEENPTQLASLAAFAFIGVGATGSIIAGNLAERRSRSCRVDLNGQP
jgi:MFS family permease